MNLKEIKKKAYEAIVKNKQSHQSFYDDNCNNIEVTKLEFAEQISKIPSKSRTQNNQILIIV